MPNLKSVIGAAAFGGLALFALPAGAPAQCPEAPPLQNFTGAGSVACPCFAPGEQAGAVLTAPADHYPLEILRIGVGWGSLYGGSPAQVEQAIHVYAGGLPDPGAPIFTLDGPQLIDGAINEFNLDPLPGEVSVDSGPFTVTLEFLFNNAGIYSAPTVVHDGNGCQAAKNVVYAIPGGWTDACALGVTGDWVFYVIYRPCVPTGVGDGPFVASTVPAYLHSPRPNPFESVTQIEFLLAQSGRADVSVYDVNGRRVATLASGDYPAGAQQVSWDGRAGDGRQLSSGVYFVKLQIPGHTSVKKVLLTK
jgi:hypothetical protein